MKNLKKFEKFNNELEFHKFIDFIVDNIVKPIEKSDLANNEIVKFLYANPENIPTLTGEIIPNSESFLWYEISFKIGGDENATYFVEFEILDKKKYDIVFTSNIVQDEDYRLSFEFKKNIKDEIFEKLSFLKISYKNSKDFSGFFEKFKSMSKSETLNNFSNMGFFE